MRDGSPSRSDSPRSIRVMRMRHVVVGSEPKRIEGGRTRLASRRFQTKPSLPRRTSEELDFAMVTWSAVLGVRVPLLCCEVAEIMPGIQFQAVRSQVSISQVLDLLGFVPNSRRGAQLRGPCPVHGSQTAGSRSFAVHLQRNAYNCFSCRSAGNQLDLWAAATKQDLHSATADLCQRLQLAIPWVHH